MDYEGSFIEVNDFSLSVNRKYHIDTDNNKKDFVCKEINPFNSDNESIEENCDIKVFIFDYLVTLANKELDISNEGEIEYLTTYYNQLSDGQKEKCKKLVLYEELLMKMEGIKNPSIAAINKAISQIPNKIVNDYLFPNIEGVTYDFITPEGNEYYKISTGEYLKVSYEAKVIKMIAYHGTESKEFTINFGLADPDDVLIYNTGTVKPNKGRTSDGFGTYNDQLSKTGFCGVAIRISGKIFFLGKNSLIELDSNKLNTSLTKKELRPYGGESLINNCGLVNGVPTAYKGTGALYYNSGDKDLTFDLSDTYGRNNSGVYGYFKVRFSSNSKGEYYVSEILPNSGTNDTTDNYQVTLKPGEYIWCPHTYETNVEGGTWLISPSTSTSGGVLIENEKIEIIHYKIK